MKWISPARARRIRRAQAAPSVTPEGAISPGRDDQIPFSPGDVSKHTASLWEFSYRELALDVGRDPRDANIAIVRLVADMKLAQTTRRAMWAAWATFTVTGVGIVIALLTNH